MSLYHKRSLNEELRKKQLVQITIENQNILKRIKDKKSSYSVKNWQKDWQQNVKYRHNICEYPDNLNPIDQSSYMKSNPRSTKNIQQNTQDDSSFLNPQQ